MSLRLHHPLSLYSQPNGTLYSLDLPPFLSYAASYCLFNYTLDSPSKGYEYSNIRLVRAFENGLDPKSSEAGFILTHIYMVKETSGLVDGAVRILNSLEGSRDREEINSAYRVILETMTRIEACMEGMSHYIQLN